MTATSDITAKGSTLLYGGPIHPMGDDESVYDAVLVENGRISALGTAEELRARAGKSALQVDLDGRTVIPGLIDTHPHALHNGMREASLIDISDAIDHRDIAERIAKHARTIPAGTWIITTPIGEHRTYVKRTYRDLKERLMPDRHVLDAAAGEHPVIIGAIAPRVPNVCAMNSMAMRLLGLNDRMPDRVSNVWADKDAQGRLTGIFRGSVNLDYNMDPYWGQVTSKIPRAGLEPQERNDAVIASLAALNALGVTTIYEPHNMTVGELDLYRQLRSDGALTVRVAGALQDEIRDVLRQPLSVDEYVDNLGKLASHLSPGDEWLRFDSLSAGVGGMIWMGTAPSAEPYLDPFGQPTTGMRFVPLDKTRAFVEFCAENGIRGNLLDGGGFDDAVFRVLEDPRVAASIREKAWVIQHAPIVSPRNMERFAALGVNATTCVGFTWSHGDMYVARVGEHLLRDATPLAKWVEAGVPMALGTDWGPHRPFDHVQLAQRLELAESGRVLDMPEHRLSRREALATWTSRGAEVLQWPDIGSLRPGAHADLAILDRDPFVCEIDEIGATEVTTTIVGGTVVHAT
ncbi:amidohydrolase family protein [Diaminobutyricimonas sp. TR449]|uniref:amidohydrolase n=1 Tax=Diaminobutyricimonas sp. TR449 TaxID=2708076 RepID=UPI001420F36A|nr:amidohydrolase family protein [Diaminobutyricimonas sp. TR449]